MVSSSPLLVHHLRPNSSVTSTLKLSPIDAAEFLIHFSVGRFDALGAGAIALSNRAVVLPSLRPYVPFYVVSEINNQMDSAFSVVLASALYWRASVPCLCNCSSI